MGEWENRSMGTIFQKHKYCSTSTQKYNLNLTIYYWFIRMQPEAREPQKKHFFWLPVPKAQRVVDYIWKLKNQKWVFKYPLRLLPRAELS
jgi:hypothetical protein